MTAPTHTSFGILSLLSIGAMMGRPATLPAVGLVTIGALLPDIDTAQSTIGRLLFPLSAWLERRLGHRGAVHSLFALMVLGFATVPLAMSNRWWWMALLIGFGSHLLLDTLNKEGVPLFYPSRVRAVMPRSQRWRIAVGSKAEMILMTVVSIFALLLLPINRAGLFQSLHALLKDIHSAIADYRAWENAYRVIADVEGGLNISQQPIAGAFEVLGVENANSLVVFDETRDALYTVGTDANANIYPKRILCRKGEPIQVITHKVHLENELLGNLLDHLPKEGQTFIKGTLKTTDRVILPKDPDHYDTIQLGINEMNLQYARGKDLEPLSVRTIFVIAGDFYIRTILPVTANEPPLTEGKALSMDSGTKPQGHSNVHTTDMYLHNVRSLKEIRVKEGQEIKVGDLIAELSDPKEPQRRLAEDGLRKQTATFNAENDPVSALFLADANKRLKAIQTEREGHRIYSPVNGRVLLIRTHAIQNQNRTIAIKLLVREP